MQHKIKYTIDKEYNNFCDITVFHDRTNFVVIKLYNQNKTWKLNKIDMVEDIGTLSVCQILAFGTQGYLY